jgi:hypothetical protein
MCKFAASWFVPLATQAIKGINAQIESSFEEFIAGRENLVGMDVLCIQFAYYLAPEPLTPEVLISYAPFARPEAFIENLLACAGRGWLVQKGGNFYLTDAGTTTVKEILALCDRLFSQIEALPEFEMRRLFALLDEITQTIKRLPEPQQKTAFTLCLCCDRGVSVSLLAQIRRRFLDLLAFWEDVHKSAWQPVEAEGQLWETFTMVRRGQAKTATELAEQLTCRYYDETDYSAALDRLVARGWLIRWGGKYSIHPQAVQIGQAVEETTKQSFEAAFCNFNFAQRNELHNLMDKCANSCNGVRTSPR